MILAYVDEATDGDEFRFKPWQGEVITPEAFSAQIAEAFAQHGYWDTYGELRMGGGPIVRLEPLSDSPAGGYRVTAEAGVKITGEFKTLDRSLEVLSVLASLVWDLEEAGVSMGSVERSPRELPWPPGPR